MRRVFLEDLPHGGKFRNANRVNWKESVGHKVNFIYDDIKGEIEIIDYDSSNYYITTLYDGNSYKIHVGSFSEAKISAIIGKRMKSHKHKIDSVHMSKSGELRIIKHTKIKNGNKGYVRGYTYECLNCNYQNNITEGHFKEGLGCPVCMNQKIKVGTNDMWTTNPEMAKLLENHEDGYQFMEQSNKKINWKCPECKTIIKNKKVSQIYYKGLSCNACSDNINYPEKIMFNVLYQLSVNFETQKLFLWSNKRVYDFYIEDSKTIVEVHGLQHYENKGFKGGRTLEEEMNNDEIKSILAKDNGIENYIIIDARKSDIEFIKNSILTSNLKKIYNLENIDWETCHKNACKSLVKSACDLWNTGLHSTSLIGNKLSLNKNTIRNYLKKGYKAGLCDYSINKSKAYAIKKTTESKHKAVICISTGEIFTSLKSAGVKCGTSPSNISAACKGKTKTAGGFKWMYKKDYDQYIEQSKNKELLHT